MGTLGGRAAPPFVQGERLSTSMNDNDIVEAVRGQEALNARPPNGARVARSLGLAGATRHPTLVGADPALRAAAARSSVDCMSGELVDG